MVKDKLYCLYCQLLVFIFLYRFNFLLAKKSTLKFT